MVVSAEGGRRWRRDRGAVREAMSCAEPHPVGFDEWVENYYVKLAVYYAIFYSCRKFVALYSALL